MPPAIQQQQEEDTVLMAASQHVTSTTNKSTSSTTNTSTTNTNTETLARNNKLRLQINELLNESVLHVHPSLDHRGGGGGGGGGNVVEAKWSNIVRSYISTVSSIISSLDETLLSPNVALLPNNNNNSSGSCGSMDGGNKYRVPLLSDKFYKSITSPSTSTSTSSTNPLTSYTFPFHGGKSLSIIPIGSFAHLYNVGLTSVHGNGNIVPVLDLAVLVNADDGDKGGKGEDGKRGEFVGGKDYLNHRYTDKRNILAIHIAKQLSQKKHRSKVGSVHITNVYGDVRKVGLLLTPPLDDNDDNDSGGNNKGKGGSKGKGGKKKRKRDNEEKKKSKKKDKLRFRIRLIFGIKPTNGQLQLESSSNNDEMSDEYSSSDDEEAGSEGREWNSWIPRSRLLPNRSNNRQLLTTTTNTKQQQHADNNNDIATISNSTPHYTNALAEDLHLVSTTNLISSTISTLTSSSNSSTTTAFHETLILLKVWSQQRGLLRGHDTFTTTTLSLLLCYLYRTKIIGKRMGSLQAFITFMKWYSDNDWLGEDSINATIGGSTSGSGDTLDATTVKEMKMKKKVAFVIPTNGKNEVQTILHCNQAKLYLDDIRGSPSNEQVPKTLLQCYKAVYTSSSSTTNASSSSISNNTHHDSPILLDPTMTINYMARLSPSFIRESRSEAYAALRYIHGHEEESLGMGGGVFNKLFLETNRFWSRYDAYVRVPLNTIVPSTIKTAADGKRKKKKQGGKGGGSSSNIISNEVWGNDITDLGYNESVCRGVVEVLGRALGDRATAIRAFTCGNGDIRGLSKSSGGNGGGDVATQVIVDSDEYYAVPIRGNKCQGFGYTSEFGEYSCLVPPVRDSLIDDVEEEEVEPSLVVGIRINPNTSRRIVDRGPAAEDVQGSQAFVALWGEQFAQLRRFQDGAIVRAVVWNQGGEGGDDNVQFAGMDRSMGGIVEKIVQHIIKLHFTGSSRKKKKETQSVSFELRNMLSFIDGVSSSSTSSHSSPFSDSLSLHKNAMTAFESLADFLRQNTKTTMDNSIGKGRKVSNLGLPLSIDEVEPLSSCLRYSALFPPVPHPLLGGSELGGGSSDKRKVSGANVGSPILIQIRFEGSSKWPTSLNAMGAAKCAMLVQLAEGVEKMREGGESGFDGPLDVTTNYLDLGYRGYSFRIIVRADQELRMLRSLRNPTLEAKALQLSLINRHVRGVMHHSLIHAVHTRHPSASSVVRLARRWVASHMLSDMIPHEAIELIVAKIYTESTTERSNSKVGSVDTPPSTVVAGFLRFLHLLSSHDWAREPLIVDPQSHITSHDRMLINAQFAAVRGPNLNKGPAMYLISPADYDGVEEMAGSKVVGENGSTEQTISANADEKIWTPTITSALPEKVVLCRAAALAKCSYDHLISCIRRGNAGDDWVAAFQESSQSLTSYSALLRVDSSFITDSGCSSTSADCSFSEKDGLCTPFEKSLQKRYAGPKELRKKHFKNLVLEKDTLHEWQPVKSLVTALRSRYSEYAVFFYNEFAPDVIAMLWRPDAFKPTPLSVVVSEFKRPASEFWKDDSLVITNTDDLMAEILYFTRNIVSTIKVFDDKKPTDAVKQTKPSSSKKKARQTESDQDEDETSSDSE